MDESSYSIVSTGDQAISVLLKAGARWPLPAGMQEVSLFVTGAHLSQDTTDILEGGSVVVATVIATPSVMRREDRVVYMTGTDRFYINGTNFRAKSTTLTFDPPLFKDVDYAMSVKSPTVAQLTLARGRTWRSDGEPGPLKLTRIDTGAGALRIDYKMGGVTVAEVQADLGAHGVTVETTSDKKLYQSSPSLTILGAGFNTTTHAELGFGNILRWGNALQGRGVNYTIVKAEPNQLTLELTPGSKWRLNPANLPAALTLLAVNAGAGPIAVGATAQKKGRAVATIYEDPFVSDGMGGREIYRTFTHEVWFEGRGFTRGSTSLDLEASVADSEDRYPLRAFVDYIAFVFNSTHLKLQLRDGRSWAPAAGGFLWCVGIDTGAGPYPEAASKSHPKIVGKIVEDATHKSGALVTRTATTQVLYETPALKKLVISGTDLCGADYKGTYDPKAVDVKLSPDPGGSSAFKVERASGTELTLSLKEGGRWPVGALYVTSIACSGNKRATFNDGLGVGVATILPDPVVTPGADLVLFRTHSKRLVVRGTGFQPDGTMLTLDPTPYSAYRVVDSTAEAVTLELTDEEGAAWAQKRDVDKAPGDELKLRVLKVDTGAGEVRFDDPGVVVATVVNEPEGDVCEDTCEFAKDGVCDDGTDPFIMDDEMRWDDDYGGYDDDVFDSYYFDDAADDDDDAASWNYDYYDDDDRDFLPACAPGTDCTDCQPRAGDHTLKEAPTAECENTCEYARDGFCDDTRTNGFCALGTDCQDCGPASAGNYTTYDDEFWDDDASNWYRDDGYGYYDDDRADDDDWAREWTDDDDYFGSEDSPEGGDPSKGGHAVDDDDDDAVGSVRSVPGPFDAYADQVSRENDQSSYNMLLVAGLVVGLPLLGFGLLRLARRGGRKSPLLPFLGKTDKKTAAELAESWSEMSERKKKALVPITPDVTYSGSSPRGD